MPSSKTLQGLTLRRNQSCHVMHHTWDATTGTRLLMDGGAKKLNFATALLLAAALCVHSVLEGMALGAQPSMRSTQDIMLAIAGEGLMSLLCDLLGLCWSVALRLAQFLFFGYTYTARLQPRYIVSWPARQ